MENKEKDELFYDAARIIVKEQQASTGLLQRRLKLGYNRANRIMDELIEAGIVSSQKSDNPLNRKINFKTEKDLCDFLKIEYNTQLNSDAGYRNVGSANPEEETGESMEESFNEDLWENYRKPLNRSMSHLEREAFMAGCKAIQIKQPESKEIDWSDEINKLTRENNEITTFGVLMELQKKFKLIKK